MPAAVPSIMIDDVVVDESHNAVFRVYLSTPNFGHSVTVNYGTGGGNATVGTDYTNTAGSLTFAPGVTEMFITVPVLDDNIAEAAEMFKVTLSVPSNATIGNAVATAYIQDNDNTPRPAVGDASATEGGAMVHTVTLSSAASTPVVYTFSLTGGTATAGSDFSTAATFSDGVTLSGGKITIPAGVTSFTVRYATTDDSLMEANETTVLSICQMSGAGTIVDNDSAPTLTVGNATATEGNNLVHTVTLSNASSVATTHAFALTGGTATAGVDFGTVPSFTQGVTLNNGVITVPAGVTSFSVSYTTANDAFDEKPFETSLLRIGTATGTGNIYDNDAVPTLAVNDVTVNEADGVAVFTVTLSAASGQTVTVAYNTGNGSALSGSDYSAITGTLTFAPGQTTKVVTVPILNDTIAEALETFNINLSGAANATIADATGVGSIIDNDSNAGHPPDAVNDYGRVDHAQGVFRLNTTTAGNQSNPDITSLSDGGYVAVWQSTDGSGTGIYTQRYDKDGDPVGSEQRVNSATANNQSDPHVTTLTDGRYLVTWTTQVVDRAGTHSNIQGQIFDENSNPYCHEFFVGRVITTPTPVTNCDPIIGLPDGGFIVTWSANAQANNGGFSNDRSGWGIFGQRYDATGKEVGSDFRVNTTTTGNQADSDVTVLSNGKLVVVWHSDQSGNNDVYTRTFSMTSTGMVPDGAETRVNTVTSGAQTDAEVTALSGGGYVVTWESAAQDGSGAGIYAQRYSASGVAAGSEFRVNTTTAGNQLNGVVTALADGGFLMTWQSPSTARGAGNDIFKQQYDASGVAVGGETRVNSVTVGEQTEPVVTTLTDGSYVIAWQSANQDGSGMGSYAMRYTATGAPYVQSNFDLNEDASLTIAVGTLLTNDTDPDNDTLTVTSVQDAQHGTVTLNANGTVTFVPTGNYYGPAQFNYTISDGHGGFDTATVFLDVKPKGETSLMVGSIQAGQCGIGTGDVTVNEGDNAVFGVRVSGATAGSQLKLTLQDGTALNADYNEARYQYSTDMGAHWTNVPANGLITLTNGFAQLMVRTDTVNDAIDEGNETFKLRAELVNSGNTLMDASAQAVIVDNDLRSLSVNDVRVDEAAGVAVFTVTLSAASSLNVTVGYNTSSGTATAGSDFTSVMGTLTFAPGVRTQTVTVPIAADAIDEANETFNVNLVSAVNARISDALGVGTILDNDGAPTVTVGNATATEGGNLVHTVTLSNASSSATSYIYSLAGVTATAGRDFSTSAAFSDGVTLSGGRLNVPAGVTCFTVTYAATQDTFDESSETTRLVVGSSSGTGTILDDDNAPNVTLNDVTVNENAGVAVFTVSLSSASSQAVTVAYNTSNGTATAGSDYTAKSGVLHFAAGATSQTVTVAITNDTQQEVSETFNVNLTSATNATIVDNLGLGTILDGDTPTVACVSNAAVTEGANLVHTVTLSGATGMVTTYAFNLAGVTATVVADFATTPTFSHGVTLAGGMITVPVGVRTFTVTYATVSDTLDEPTETTRLSVGNMTGVGSIADNDGVPALSINDLTVNEAEGVAVFTVSLSAASGQAVTVAYSTANGTAAAGSDYTSAFGSLTFAPGQMTRSVTVPILNDLIDETNETFRVNLASPVNATIADAQGVATIIDNESTPTVVSVSAATAIEGVALAHTVTLSGASTVVTTHSFSLVGVTATAGSDFGAVPTFSNGVTLSNGIITVPAGVSSFSVMVSTVNDTLDEAIETTRLTVDAVSATGNITDNDATPGLSVGDVTVSEGEGTAVFTVSLSAASGQTVTVAYNTSNGSAVAGSDYSHAVGTLTFAPGQTTRTVTVPLLDDAVGESTENFTVNLNAPTNAIIVDGTGGGTILDNDCPPAISINNISVTEPIATGAQGPGVFTITLSHAYGQAVTVHYATSNGSANAGSDYLAASGDVTFAPGQTSKTITVMVLGDAVSESAESFNVNLSCASNATISDGLGVCTIPQNASPIVLDLEGDGVQSVGTAAGVNFDILNDGVVRQVGWAGAQDGLLVRDLNRDGQINNGAELFGEATADGKGGKTADGFQALATLDDNKDGVINSLDLGWKDLQVWRDANTDGVTDQGELLSLQTAGVLSLNLAHTTSDKVENGNLHMLVGDYTTTRGETREMTDVFFATDERLATEAVALHGKDATDTGLTFDPSASVWQVGAEDGNVVLKGFDINHDVLDLRDLLGGQQGDNLDGLLSIKKEGSSTVLEVKDTAGSDHSIVFAGVDLLGGNTDQQVIHDLLNSHKVVVD